MEKKSVSKIENIKDYRDWFEEKFHVYSNYVAYYNSVVNKMIVDISKSRIWLDIIENLEDIGVQYEMKKKYSLLLYPNENIKVLGKEYDSLIDKTYRKNVLNNNKWPNEPASGWISPDNWFSKINDIVRTSIVVRYIDGVEFLVEKIKQIVLKNKNKIEVQMEAKDEGYYAAHIYIPQEVEIQGFDRGSEIINVKFEIQITTQLQEVIKKLLHKYYETKRISSKSQDKNWKWDYKSDEFAANYLGHILHYVEGMIVEIQEKQRKSEE